MTLLNVKWMTNQWHVLYSCVMRTPILDEIEFFVTLFSSHQLLSFSIEAHVRLLTMTEPSADGKTHDCTWINKSFKLLTAEASDITANLFGLKMIPTVSHSSTTEPTMHVIKAVFNEDSVDSIVARQLELWQPRTKALIGCLEIRCFLVALWITQYGSKHYLS